MGDKEGAVVDHEIGGRNREQYAGHAADDERDHEADATASASKRTRPPIVNSQLKTLTPVGTAMITI